MAGISGLPNRRFQFFNWLSALLWVCVVTGLGYALSMIPFVKRHEDQVMTCLMILADCPAAGWPARHAVRGH
ncbi:DedA family inner membrane protein YghB [Klebsiella pneumoniae]|uniref:DedA family inner membrane protein YghB n=1 Tax=Klebsiella pneumoniae TaxID=573 RepID=A0A377XGM1_KLEPN|nr:DedA family inner membrane protein YghB [Klebsiella pneumoniae]